MQCRTKSGCRLTPTRVQHLQTAFGAPGAYAPGVHPAMESGLTNHQLSEELDQQRGSRQLRTSLSPRRCSALQASRFSFTPTAPRLKGSGIGLLRSRGMPSGGPLYWLPSRVHHGEDQHPHRQGTDPGGEGSQRAGVALFEDHARKSSRKW